MSVACPSFQKDIFRELNPICCSHRFGEVAAEPSRPSGFDQVRRVEIGEKHIALDFFEEVYTSSNWLVRVYKLKKHV